MPTLGKITKDHMVSAANMATSDEACNSLQTLGGIATGDLAGLHFAGYDWEDRLPADRLQSLMRWIEDEGLFADECDGSFESIARLGQLALPIQEFPEGNERGGRDDWGSERQIEAQNLFTNEVRKTVSDDLWDRYDAYCHKATVQEMVTEGLRICREAIDETNRQAGA